VRSLRGAGIAPSLRELMTEYAATGLRPACVPPVPRAETRNRDRSAPSPSSRECAEGSRREPPLPELHFHLLTDDEPDQGESLLQQCNTQCSRHCNRIVLQWTVKPLETGEIQAA
jgi:hypothetical protein